jgi:hypothetical protein
MLVMALEHYDERMGLAEKAAILHHDVVGRHAPRTTVQSAEEGLLVSLDQRGVVDLPYIATLYAAPVRQIIAELGDLIYQEPDTQVWHTADVYLSGEDLHLRERERQEAQILQQPTPSREWVGGGLRDAQIMDPAAVSVAQKEDDEERIDEEDIFDGVVLSLAAITRGLLRRVLGADDPPLGAVVGQRGAAGAAVGTATTGADSSSNGVTTVAAATSETPRCWARAVRERAGASPRARSAASNTGNRTWIH